MPAPFVAEAVTEDEPQITHDPQKDDSGIKAMAAKFRELWPGPGGEQPKPAPTAENPNPPAAPSQKPAVATKPEVALAAKPEPAPAPDAEAEIEDVKIDPTTPISRDHYKRLENAKDSYKARAEKFRQDHKAAQERAKQLEEELTKTKAALPPNLEEVQKALADSTRISAEHKAAIEQLETLKLERSPRFQNWWNTETQKHVKVAKAHVPPEHRDKFAKLIMEDPSEERDAAIDQILEPLSNTAKRLASGALEQLESLKIQRDEALTQGSERYKQLQAFEKAERDKAERDQQTRIQTLSDDAVRRAKQTYSAFQPTGDATKDAAIAEREAFVRGVISGKMDEETVLGLPAAAVEYLHLRDNVVPGLKAELAKQAELLKQLQGSSPSPSAGKGSGQGKAKEPEAGTSFASRVRELMQK